MLDRFAAECRLLLPRSGHARGTTDRAGSRCRRFREGSPRRTEQGPPAADEERRLMGATDTDTELAPYTARLLRAMTGPASEDDPFRTEHPDLTKVSDAEL